jgi:hypothetical protein
MASERPEALVCEATARLCVVAASEVVSAWTLLATAEEREISPACWVDCSWETAFEKTWPY